MTRVLVIIPAYNEAASLPAVIQDLRAFTPLLIRWWSTMARPMGRRRLRAVLMFSSSTCRIISGIGGAVQTGLLYAVRERYDYAVQFDGDGQHRADQLDALLVPVIARRADVAIGSRFLLPNPIRCRWRGAVGSPSFGRLMR